jgi:hypothetical protein
MKTHHVLLLVPLFFFYTSCSEADQISGTYNGTFNVTGNGSYTGYLDVSVVNANTINIQPGSSSGIMTAIESIVVTKSGPTYNLDHATTSNVQYLTGYINNTVISCTYNYGGSSTYSFSGAK